MDQSFLRLARPFLLGIELAHSGPVTSATREDGRGPVSNLILKTLPPQGGPLSVVVAAITSDRRDSNESVGGAAMVWRRCMQCGLYFERASMSPDPLRRPEFGKPAFVCADCKSKIEQEQRPATGKIPKSSANH
jgi:hypothetical protein